MALALIYIFATAKPVSIRRLAALLVSTSLMTMPALRVFGVHHAQKDALAIGALLALIIWSIPLVRTVRDSVRRRSLSLNALQSVSFVVLCTYAFTLAALPVVAVSEVLNPSRVVHLRLLLQPLAIAVFIALFVRTKPDIDGWRRVAKGIGTVAGNPRRVMPVADLAAGTNGRPSSCHRN